MRTGLAAGRGQFRGPRPRGFFRLLDLLTQGGERFVAALDVLHFPFQLPLAGEHRLDAATVFLLEIGDQRQPRIDLVQPPRVGAQAFGVAAQGQTGLLDLRQAFVQQTDHLAQAVVHVDQLAQLGRQPPDPVRHRVVARDQAVLATGRGLVQLFGVDQDRPFAAQPVFLVRLQGRAVDFVQLEADQVLPLRGRGGTPPPVVQTVAGRAQRRVAPHHFLHLGTGLGEIVQQAQPRVDLAQDVLLVLAVDLHQPAAHLAQHRERGQGAVEIHPPAAGVRDHAAHDQLRVRGQPVRVEHGRHAVGVHAEHGLDDEFRAAAADQVAARAAAQGEADSLHQQALAGAGLAGHHVQPGRERQFQFVDQGDVADVQQAQHDGWGGGIGRAAESQPTPRREISSRRSLSIRAMFRKIRAPMRG